MAKRDQDLLINNKKQLFAPCDDIISKAHIADSISTAKALQKLNDYKSIKQIIMKEAGSGFQAQKKKYKLKR